MYRTYVWTIRKQSQLLYCTVPYGTVRLDQGSKLTTTLILVAIFQKKSTRFTTSITNQHAQLSWCSPRHLWPHNKYPSLQPSVRHTRYRYIPSELARKVKSSPSGLRVFPSAEEAVNETFFGDRLDRFCSLFESIRHIRQSCFLTFVFDPCLKLNLHGHQYQEYGYYLLVWP